MTRTQDIGSWAWADGSHYSKRTDVSTACRCFGGIRDRRSLCSCSMSEIIAPCVLAMSMAASGVNVSDLASNCSCTFLCRQSVAPAVVRRLHGSRETSIVLLGAGIGLCTHLLTRFAFDETFADGSD